MSESFDRALHALRTAPGVSAGDLERIKEGILATAGPSEPDLTGYFDLGGGEDADTTIRHVIPGCTWTAVIPADDDTATMGDIYALTRAHAETCPALHGSKEPTP